MGDELEELEGIKPSLGVIYTFINWEFATADLLFGKSLP